MVSPRPMVRSLLLLALVLLPGSALAQREGLLQIGSPLSDFVRRQATLGTVPQFSADALPIPTGAATALVDSIAADPAALAALSPADRQLVERYRSREPASAFGWTPPYGFYGDGVSPVYVEGDGYALELAPVIGASIGPTQRTDRDERDPSAPVYRNTRGFRTAGRLGHLYFEARATENQRRPAFYERDAASATAPRYGFVKRLGDDAYDYFTAEGGVGYRDRFVDVRFARDRNQWGPGMGTLFLSNYAAPYDHLRIGAQAGPLHYTMAVARLTTPDRDSRGRDSVLPSKYAAFHRVSIEAGRFQAEAFEAVVFQDDTLTGNRRGPEIGYLNPVIFYRAVESELGSGDNALIGLGAAVRPVDGVRLYGQVLIDEFVADRFFEDSWVNKWGLLAGAHIVDLGLPGLEARAEYARLRPYLYGHRSENSAYVHYNDVLGHPIGPNADDLSLFVRYRPSARVTTQVLATRARRGRDPDSLYVGADPRVSYDERASSVSPTFDGVRQSEWLIEGSLAFELLPRLAVEAAGLYRAVDDAERGLDRAAAVTVGLRWELPFQSVRY